MRGSARFAPYYKVQEFDPRSAVWVDIQKAHATPAAAQAAFPAGKSCRVVGITERQSPLTHAGRPVMRCVLTGEAAGW